MRNLYLCLLFIQLAFCPLLSQCPVEDLILFNQAQVDNFLVDFPNCTIINGDLSIGELDGTPSDITDLSALSNLIGIEGSFTIANNPLLTNLAGLENITQVASFVDISQNASLTNLSAISNLDTIPDCLRIDDNNQLTNLIGLDNLNGLSGPVGITNNAALVSLAGLSFAANIGDDLIIENNSALNSLTDLANLDSLGGDLFIGYNPMLTDLDGLENLQQLFGRLLIYNNDSLEDLDGLSGLNRLIDIYIRFNPILNDLTGLTNLNHVLSTIQISNNDQISSLSGLENIILNAVGFITIKDNPMLTDCAITNLCAYIINVGNVDIMNNSSECNSSQEVLDNCADCPSGDVQLSTQAELETFAYNYPNCIHLAGSLTIAGNSDDADIDDLTVLQDFESIGGNLSILSNPKIFNLEGFSSLKSIGGNLSINSNDIMFNIIGFNNLELIGGNLSISANDVLTNVFGFNDLEIITERLTIGSNPALSNIQGFSALDSIGSNLTLLNLPALEDISVFSNINALANGLVINSVEKLTDLSVFSNLDSLRFLLLIDNAQLNDISGLANIDPDKITSIEIRDNPQLSNCAIESLCIYLDDFGNAATVSNNNNGCNSRTEVLDACNDMPNSILNPSIQAISLYPNPSTGQVQLQIDNISHLKVFNGQGQEVSGYRLVGQELDMYNLTNGLYYLHIQSADRQYRAKLLKM